MKHNIRVALMRAVPTFYDLEGNLHTFLNQAEHAARRRVNLLITPETFLDGYVAKDKDCTPATLKTVAQDVVRSPLIGKVREAARRGRMWIVFGFTQRLRGKCYNAAALIDARGRVAGVYHKTHLQKHDLKYSFGRSLPVFRTPWGPLGIAICADRRWPETFRCLRLQGARLIANPTYGMCHLANEWWMRTRSYENQCFVCFNHPRVSLVTNPAGEIEAKQIGRRPGLLVADLDLSLAKNDNHLADRRPDLYGVLAKRNLRRVR